MPGRPTGNFNTSLTNWIKKYTHICGPYSDKEVKPFDHIRKKFICLSASFTLISSILLVSFASAFEINHSASVDHFSSNSAFLTYCSASDHAQNTFQLPQCFIEEEFESQEMQKLIASLAFVYPDLLEVEEEAAQNKCFLQDKGVLPYWMEHLYIVFQKLKIPSLA